DGEGHLRRMEIKGELRGHLGWQSDIIQPWGHNRRGAIAVKRRGRRTVYGYVIVVTRDTGRAEGEHHFGPHRHHDPPHVMGERGKVGGAELVIAVVQQDRRVDPVEGEYGAQFRLAHGGEDTPPAGGGTPGAGPPVPPPGGGPHEGGPPAGGQKPSGGSPPGVVARS